jgi:N-acetylglucosaminyldiphosphoundecaprenol N-acetyl-beta-D-mannosaminyltransferase
MMPALKSFETVEVLDVKFNKVTVHQLLDYAISSAKLSQKTVIGHVNVRAMNLAYELPWYKNFFNQTANLVFCDGFGVLLGAKLMGYSMRSEHRMTCPDYIEDLALACERHDVSLFLVAGEPEVVDKALLKLKAAAPHLRISGHHGYFEKSGLENDRVVQQINEFKPGILYIGFGMPMQEKWIMENFNRLDAKVFLPLGACLDFYTDTVYRGPRWMTDRGMEWLSRLFAEPSRLWGRYVIGNPLFFYRLLKRRFLRK